MVLYTAEISLHRSGQAALVGRYYCKIFCEGVRVVKGDEAPLGGVAQVILHGVRVVEIGVHEEGEKEKDGEVKVEVKGEVEENQRQQHMCDMRMT